MNAKNDQIPKLRPTPLTWLYVAMAFAIIALGVWGFVIAGNV